MVDEPTRPGSSPSSATNQATVDSQITGLADVIKSSTAKHVVMLVMHTQNYDSALASNDEAAQTLTDAGFDICSELDPRRTYRAPTFGFVVDTPVQAPPKIPVLAIAPQPAPSQLRDKVQSALKAFREIAKAKTAKVAIHLVGDHLVTAKEALLAARASINKSEKKKLKIEDLYLQAAKRKFHKGLLQNNDATVKQLAEDIYNNTAALGFPMALADLILAVSSRVTDTKADDYVHYARELLRKNGIGEHPNPAKEQESLQALAEQIENIVDRVQELRIAGAADANSVKNALARLNGRRGLFIFGAIHGMLANTPASLPDQLLVQDKGASREIIVTVDKASAGAFFRVMTARHEKGELRTDIKVYDVEKKQVWNSAQEWLVDAAKPSFYNDKGLVAAPKETPAP